LKRTLFLTNIKNKNYSLTQEFLTFLKDSFAIDSFIETGTYLGESAYNASKVFKNIYTIELSQKLYAEASKRYASANINFYCGDSAKVLKEMLPQIKGKALFWLDGHYSGGATAKAGKNTPILEEIEALKSSGINEAIVLVDDIRLFEKMEKTDEGLSGYPGLHELIEALLSLNPSYKYALLGDILIAYLPNDNFEVSDVIKSCTISRLYQSNNHAEILKTEEQIINAQNEEREYLLNLPEIFASTEQHGFGFHYRLWKALVLLGSGNVNEAKTELIKAKNFGAADWRVDYYSAVIAKGCGDNSLYESLILSLKKSAPFLFNFNGNNTMSNIYTTNGELNKAIDLKIRNNQPVKFHLGCGENMFPGYINIDYPPEFHVLMNCRPDVYADILTMDVQPGVVDEVRLHHVFEHFSRVKALSMLIKWHQWLKIGGRLVIETPDLKGSAKMIASDAPLKLKMGAVRHLAGDQAVAWAYHIDHWFKERYEAYFPPLGFEMIDVKETSWEREPYLANIQVTARKIKNYTIDELIANSEPLFWLSAVSEREKPAVIEWMRQLREIFYPAVTAAPVQPPAERSNNGSDNSALTDLAEIEFKSGNLAKAKRLALTALSVDPNSARAKNLLNKL
ncbi:MAG TPA: hypothetical protein VHO28_09845, partial [Ignavibacteriales bacterium]|nr:hypothetical protein [Ignavibacteriales bacterium]